MVALQILKDEDCAEKARVLGEKFRSEVAKIKSPLIESGIVYLSFSSFWAYWLMCLLCF